MDSMDELSGSLKKLERYNFLFYLTGRMIITALIFLVVVLFVYVLLLMNNFHEINPSFGTVRLSGAADFGTFLNIFALALITGAVVVYGMTLRMNRRALGAGKWEADAFDRTTGRNGLLGAITGIDWAKARNQLKKAKFSFVLYNLSIVGIYSFLIFFVLLFLSFFVFSFVLSFIMNALNTSLGLDYEFLYAVISALAILISVVILRKNLKKSFVELRELDTMLSELRWFLDEFEKSGFQA